MNEVGGCSSLGSVTSILMWNCSFSLTTVLLFCLQMKTVGSQERCWLADKPLCQWSDSIVKYLSVLDFSMQWLPPFASVSMELWYLLPEVRIQITVTWCVKLPSRLWHRKFLNNAVRAYMNGTVCSNINLPDSKARQPSKYFTLLMYFCS